MAVHTPSPQFLPLLPKFLLKFGCLLSYKSCPGTTVDAQ